MICPKCKNVHTCVVDSRHDTNLINRRRWCPNCDNRFSTVEINKDEYKEILKQLKTIQQLPPMLKKLADDVIALGKEIDNG